MALAVYDATHAQAAAALAVKMVWKKLDQAMLNDSPIETHKVSESVAIATQVAINLQPSKALEIEHEVRIRLMALPEGKQFLRYLPEAKTTPNLVEAGTPAAVPPRSTRKKRARS
jgi:hypothetical protein